MKGLADTEVRRAQQSLERVFDRFMIAVFNAACGLRVPVEPVRFYTKHDAHIGVLDNDSFRADIKIQLVRPSVIADVVRKEILIWVSAWIECRADFAWAPGNRFGGQKFVGQRSFRSIRQSRHWLKRMVRKTERYLYETCDVDEYERRLLSQKTKDPA